MRIGNRAYVLNASVGIGASIIGGTTRKNKSRFGRIAYIGTALLKVLASRPRYLVVTVDGKAHLYRAIEVAIMNCGLLGRLFYPQGPDIRIDDGHLGVWILSMKTIWDYRRYLIGVVAGWTVNPEAQFIRAEKTVSIRSNTPLPGRYHQDEAGRCGGAAGRGHGAGIRENCDRTGGGINSPTVGLDPIAPVY